MYDDKTYRTLFDRAPFGIAVATPDGTFVDVNDAFVAMLGFSREEALSMTFLDITHDEDKDESFRLVEEMRSGKRTYYKLEKRYLRKNGSELWGNVTVSAIYDSHGDVECWLGIMEDISERRQAEAAREIYHETVVNVLDSIDADVYVSDLHTYEILYMNRSMEADFGGNHVGSKCWAVFRECDSPCEHCTNSKLLDESGTPTGVYAWEGHNPTTDKWYMNYDRAVKWLDGRFVRLQVATDISEMKRMEKELQKAEKLESLGVLAGGIAHDFNNLLAAILGNISLAKLEATRESELSEILEEAERATQRATGLTKQLLTFSRGGAPVKQLSSMAEIVRESAGFARRGWDCGFELNIDPELWHAEVDEGQVSHAIHNIVLNAGQALQGNGTISVTAENRLLTSESAPDLSPGKYVCISIKDNGPGIAQKDLGKIYDPYFSTKTDGSGLGLTTAYSVIQQHRGSIRVDSVVGEGTSFAIYLPATDQLPLDLVFEDDPIEERHQSSGAILLMDDEPMNRTVVSRMLERIGYGATAVADGKDAVEAYQEAIKAGEPFCAVILDLTVPNGLGGVETIKKLKSIDPNIIAIVSSGYSTDPAMAQFDEYGFAARAEKPYRIDELRNVLSSVLAPPD